jgi:hypothetical protein
MEPGRDVQRRELERGEWEPELMRCIGVTRINQA